MLVAGKYDRYGLYTAPEFVDPNAMEALSWNFERAYIPSWLVYYVDHWNLGPTNYAVVYSGNDDDKLDALFKFNYKEKTKTLISKGTLVAPLFRDRGIAKRMWSLAIEKFAPTKIIAIASTRDGLRFINKLKKEYPSIVWKIEETL